MAADFEETIGFRVIDDGAIKTLKDLDVALTKVDDELDRSKEAAKEAAKEQGRLAAEAKKTAVALKTKLAKEARDAAAAERKLEAATKKAAAALRKDLAQAAAKAGRELEDLKRNKIMGVKRAFEGLGISGEALTSVYTLMGFGVAMLSREVIRFAREAMTLAIASSEAATLASDRLGDSWDQLIVTSVDATIGIGDMTTFMEDLSKTIDGANAVIKTAAKDQDSWTATLRDAGAAILDFNGPIDLLAFAYETVATELQEAGEVAVASTPKFVKNAEGFWEVAKASGVAAKQYGVVTAELRKYREEMERVLDANRDFTTSIRGQEGSTEAITALGDRLPLTTAQIARLNKAFGRDKFGQVRQRRTPVRAQASEKGKGEEDVFAPILPGDIAGLLALGASGFDPLSEFEQGMADIRKQAGELAKEIAKVLDVMDGVPEAMAAADPAAVAYKNTMVDLAVGGIDVVTNSTLGMVEALAAGEFSMASFAQSALSQFGQVFQSVGKGLFFQGIATANPTMALAGGSLAVLGAVMSGGSKRLSGAGSGASAGTGAEGRAQTRDSFRRQQRDDRATRDLTPIHITMILAGQQFEQAISTTDQRMARRRQVPIPAMGRR